MKNRALPMVRLAEFGIWQFFILTIVAMIVFPGGTLQDATREGYSFTNNFFSDLGRTVDFEGNRNPARWVFTLAVTITGLAMCGFFLAMPAIFRGDERFDRSKYIAMAFGLVAGLCYIGVAFTPYDIRFSGHEISVKVGFSAFLIASLIMTWMIYKSRYYPNIYGHIFIAFDIILLYYVYLLFFGPDARASQEGLVLQVISQKVVVYAEIVCMLIQMRGARFILQKIPEG